jgi:hypothetical protein
MQQTSWNEIHLASAALDNSLVSSCCLLPSAAASPSPLHWHWCQYILRHVRKCRLAKLASCQQGGAAPCRPPAVVASLGDRWGCQRRPGSLPCPVRAASGAKGSGRRSRRGGALPGAERRPAARRPPASATAQACRSGLPGRTWRWAPCWRRGSRRPYTPACCTGDRSPSRRPASARTRSGPPGPRRSVCAGRGAARWLPGRVWRPAALRGRSRGRPR